MLARLLKFATFTVVIAAASWLSLMWSSSLALALIGLFLGLFAFVPFLGAQFFAMWRVNSHDPVPAVSAADLFSAWWAEALLVLKIFFWWQPFRWNEIPDVTDRVSSQDGRRGVVFIHGFVCNRGLWTPWMRQMQQSRRTFVAVNLEPVFGSIDCYAASIDDAISQVTKATGTCPLVVCHSMGGLAVRAWLRSTAGNDARVHHIVTIGTPHQGTWLGRFGMSTNGKQMRLGSRWLQQLQAEEPPERYKLFTCFYSNCDNIVFPASTATLPGANNRLINGVAHVALAFDHAVMQAVNTG